MKLDELESIQKSKQIGKILEGHFGFHIDPNRINAESANLMLQKTTEIIEEFKRSPDFHKSESNPKYLQALMIEQALESLMKEYNWVGKGADPQKKANTLAPGIKEPDEDEEDWVDDEDITVRNEDELADGWEEEKLNPVEDEDDSEYEDPRDLKDDTKNYQKGDRIVLGGRDYVLDEFEDDTWYMSDQDGGEVEFTPGTEDLHEPGYYLEDRKTENKDLNRIKKLAGLKYEDIIAKENEQLNESEVEQAQVVLAAQDLLDRITKMYEDVAEMQYKDLPNLASAMKEELGVNATQVYFDAQTATLSALVGALEEAKTSMDSAMGSLTGEEMIEPEEFGDVDLGPIEPDVDADADAEADVEPELEPELDDTTDFGREKR